MNTLKGRLENKTNKVLHAFETLERLSAAGDEIQVRLKILLSRK
jgi:hypothetical protein